MIYITFNETQRQLRWLENDVRDYKKTANNYLVDVCQYVGAISTKIGNHDVLVVHCSNEVFVYDAIDRCKSIFSLTTEEIAALCENVHNLHLVEEFGENKETEAKNDVPSNSDNSN